MAGTVLDLVVTKNTNANYWLVDFTGDLDSYTIQLKRKELQELVNSLDKQQLVFNFQNLNYINSECIGMLFQYIEQLKTAGKELILVGAKKHVQDVLQTIGIYSQVKNYRSFADYLSV